MEMDYILRQKVRLHVTKIKRKWKNIWQGRQYVIYAIVLIFRVMVVDIASPTGCIPS